MYLIRPIITNIYNKLTADKRFLVIKEANNIELIRQNENFAMKKHLCGKQITIIREKLNSLSNSVEDMDQLLNECMYFIELESKKNPDSIVLQNLTKNIN
jgi:hypothetical protein